MLWLYVSKQWTFGGGYNEVIKCGVSVNGQSSDFLPGVSMAPKTVYWALCFTNVLCVHDDMFETITVTVARPFSYSDDKSC